MGGLCGTNGGKIYVRVYIILMENHEDRGLCKTQEQISGDMKIDVKQDMW